MKGLLNIGNTCYLNAGLQMLVQNNSLCELIVRYSNKSDLLNTISEFINDYNNTEIAAVNPQNIKKIVEDKHDLFTGFNQQDSTEFIICFLNIIDDEIKKINKESKEVDELFGIKLNIRIKCKLKKCLKTYNHNEINNYIFFDLTSETKNLDDCYRMFKSSEKLELENKYFCENCNGKRIASKRTSIEEWPPQLFVCLRRFNQNGNRIYKNKTSIDIPLTWRHNYVLQGAVIHFGDIGGGHYIYVGKNNGKWFIHDDSTIHELYDVSQLDKLLSNAYFLYYVKQD